MSASLATGALRAPFADRGDDCYETPAEAVGALLRVERLARRVWEPACGPGAIVRPLRAAGFDVVAGDLVDYGLEDASTGDDFLLRWRPARGARMIVTNPPFKLAEEFVSHALALCPDVIMLLRLAFLEGAGRSALIDRHLARVWLGRERLPMMHRRGWDGPKLGAGTIPYAWFVFTQAETHGNIALRRMSWRGN